MWRRRRREVECSAVDSARPVGGSAVAVSANLVGTVSYPATGAESSAVGGRSMEIRPIRAGIDGMTAEFGL